MKSGGGARPAQGRRREEVGRARPARGVNWVRQAGAGETARRPRLENLVGLKSKGEKKINLRIDFQI
jgi:hypothetical protein